MCPSHDFGTLPGYRFLVPGVTRIATATQVAAQSILWPVTDRPPQHSPSPRELDDLELLCHGVLGTPPLRGRATGWCTLGVPPQVAEEASRVGRSSSSTPRACPLAAVSIEGTYPAGELIGIVGAVHAAPAERVRRVPTRLSSPSETPHASGSDAITVPVQSPLDERDLDRIRTAAHGRPILLLTLTGHGTPSYAGRRALGDRADPGDARRRRSARRRDRSSRCPLASRGPGRGATTTS